MDAPRDNEVNQHYLNHVVEASSTCDIEASEDILASNGMKLVSKGSSINGSVRERLLSHKLRRPLETCMQVTNSVSGDELAQTAQALLDQHAMLKALYWSDGGSDALGELRRSANDPALRTLLTIYGKHREGKLRHAVGTSLLCMGLLHRIKPANGQRMRAVMTAGLYHDIGELYIDPELFAKAGQLSPEQWKHIAAHPVVAQRVLDEMPQAGRSVGKAILEHHERLDGFGYPRRLRGADIGLEGQVLAAAELLMGLLESGKTPLRRAAVAAKLIPGEFDRRIVDIIATVCRGCASDGALESKPAEERKAGEGAGRVAQIMRNVRQAEQEIVAGIEASSSAAKGLYAQIMQRFDRIHLAFSSTGLDVSFDDGRVGEQVLLAEADLYLEVSLILSEIRWRLRELARELTGRMSSLAASEITLFEQMIGALRDD